MEIIFVDTQKDFFVWMMPPYICKRKSPTAVEKIFNGVVVNEDKREFIGKWFLPNNFQKVCDKFYRPEMISVHKSNTLKCGIIFEPQKE